jgi:transcriptional regulator NrdR family protein
MILSGTTKQLTPFSRDKLFISLYHSCGHRQAAVADAAALSDTIVAQLLHDHQRSSALLTKSEIKQVTIRALQRFDLAAATYYQAYYVD